MKSTDLLYATAVALVLLMAFPGFTYAAPVTGVEYGVYELSSTNVGLLFAEANRQQVVVKPRSSGPGNPTNAYRWKFIRVPNSPYYPTPPQDTMWIYQIQSVEYPGYCLGLTPGSDRLGLVTLDTSNTLSHWTFNGLASGYRRICTVDRVNGTPRRALVVDASTGHVDCLPLAGHGSAMHWKLYFPEPVWQATGVGWLPETQSPNFHEIEPYRQLGCVGVATSDIDEMPGYVGQEEVLVGWEAERYMAYCVGWNYTNAGYALHWRGPSYIKNELDERYQLPWDPQGLEPLGGVELVDLMGSGNPDLVYFVAGPTRDQCGFVVAPDIDSEGRQIINTDPASGPLAWATWYPYPRNAWLPYDDYGPDAVIKGVGFTSCSLSEGDSVVDLVCFFVYNTFQSGDPDMAAYVLIKNVQLLKWDEFFPENFNIDGLHNPYEEETWIDFYLCLESEKYVMPPIGFSSSPSGTGSPGDKTQGAGIAVGDIGGSADEDILVYVVDDAVPHRRGRFIVGTDLNEYGAVTGGWGNWIWANEAVTPPLAPFGCDGVQTLGAGVALVDLDRDGYPASLNPDPELIYLHSNLLTDMSVFTLGTLWSL